MEPRRPRVRLTQGPVTATSLEAEIAQTLDAVAPQSDAEIDRTFEQWLNALWSVGEWLREEHAEPAIDGAAPTWRQPLWLPAPHRSSLETWGRLLARGNAPLHGPLGLDRIHRTANDVVEVVADERHSGDPAADVGGVVADLLRLEWQFEHASTNRLARLVTAFTTSYCGLPPTAPLSEAGLRRTIALRSVHRSRDDAPKATRARLRALIEQSWLPVD